MLSPLIKSVLDHTTYCALQKTVHAIKKSRFINGSFNIHRQKLYKRNFFFGFYRLPENNFVVNHIQYGQVSWFYFAGQYTF